MPKDPVSVTWELLSQDDKAFASKAVLQTFELYATTEKGTVCFPFSYCYQKGKLCQKTVLLLNFRGDIPDKFLPAEEIIDRGWNFAVLNHKDITGDNREINENYRLLSVGENGCETGKLAMWAWGAMRVIDHLQTR